MIQPPHAVNISVFQRHLLLPLRRSEGLEILQALTIKHVAALAPYLACISLQVSLAYADNSRAEDDTSQNIRAVDIGKGIMPWEKQLAILKVELERSEEK